jgi:uncharacterized Zn finger protein
MAETISDKALRYLDEGRIQVVRAAPPPGLVVARAVGSAGARYDLGYDAERREWRCTCPARVAECAHLYALKLVVGEGRPT